MKVYRWPILITILLLLLGGSLLLLKSGKNDKKAGHLLIENKIQKNMYPVGAVKACAKNPEFPLLYGLNPPFLIDLRQRGYRGLRIVEYKENGKILQLPEWSAFGWLGLFTNDEEGHIYLSSIPQESLEFNRPEDQNRILKLDSKTGELYEFIKIQSEFPPNMRNPFGAIGIHYDCDNKSLYVSTLAGSSIKTQNGQINQYDLQSRELISSFNGIDVLGLSTFNTVNGKRLYFGLARESEVHSIGLDPDGKIIGPSRKELSLIDQPGGSFDKAFRIRFKGEKMEVKANEFTYTLAASSDPQTNIYTFQYDAKNDKWVFLNISPEIRGSVQN